MPTFPIRISGQLGGVNRTRKEDQDYDNRLVLEKSGASALGAAKTGTLTTRTDDNTGTLTMAGGHGITTGDFLFLFWDGGSRRTIAGTVSVNSVPIDLGAGDNLPVATTAITAFVASPEVAALTGNDQVAIRFTATRRGAVQVTDASDVELAAEELNTDNGYTYIWWTGSGVTNPLAGDAVGKVKFGNGDSAGTNVLTAEFMYN